MAWCTGGSPGAGRERHFLLPAQPLALVMGALVLQGPQCQEAPRMVSQSSAWSPWMHVL